MPNPHLHRVDRDALPEHLQPIWDMSRDRTGDATIIEVFANHPAMLDWYFNSFYKGLFYNEQPGMTVDIRTKELLRLKLSKQHGCFFCNNFNSVDAKVAGITQDQIDNLLTPSAAHFDERDLAIIDLAEQMTLQNMHGEMSRELYQRLRKFYDDRQLVEIGFIAAVLTGMAKYIFTYDLVVREEVCPIRPAVTA